MYLPDDTTSDTSIRPGERPLRAASRRDIINEKRHKNTDILPKINGEMTGSKAALRQIAQLREENKRLRWELNEQQRLITHHKNVQAHLEQEIEAIQHTHQQAIEQYDMHLLEMIEEHKQLQEEKQQLERRYQELDHTFHDTVELEASKLVEEAAQTLTLSPEHTPPLLRDVAKTLEFQTKQTEDQHVAQLLSLIRQAQHKASLLDQELANEREKIAADRQNLLAQQNSIREQAQYRYKTMRQHLQTRWTLILTLMAAVLIVLVTLFQLIFVSLKFPLGFALFIPVVICIGLAFLFARIYTENRLKQAGKKLDQKTTATPAKETTPTPATKKLSL